MKGKAKEWRGRHCVAPTSFWPDVDEKGKERREGGKGEGKGERMKGKTKGWRERRKDEGKDKRMKGKTKGWRERRKDEGKGTPYLRRCLGHGKDRDWHFTSSYYGYYNQLPRKNKCAIEILFVLWISPIYLISLTLWKFVMFYARSAHSVRFCFGRTDERPRDCSCLKPSKLRLWGHLAINCNINRTTG